MKVQSESDSMSRAGFTVPYHFSISITDGFAFGHFRVFMLYIYNMRHLKG